MNVNRMSGSTVVHKTEETVMLSGKRGMNVRRSLILVCAVVLAFGLFNTTALASSPAYRLSGRWSCYYSYSMYWNQQVMDEEFYTFYGIYENKGYCFPKRVTFPSGTVLIWVKAFQNAKKGDESIGR